MSEVAVYPARPGLSVKDLIETAERELASLGFKDIDEAADAALTLSGLRIESWEAAEEASEGDSKTRDRDTPGAFEMPANLHASGCRQDEEGTSNSSEESGQISTSAKRKRARKDKGHGQNSKRRALYAKAIAVASSAKPEGLPHSSQGYIGLEALDGSEAAPGDGLATKGPLPASAPKDAHPELVNLLRGNYALVPSDGRPTIFTDVEGRIISWRVGSVGGECGEARDERRNQNLLTAVEKMATQVKSKKSAGVPRGDHRWAHWGYSYGGGETKPMNKQQTRLERDAWNEFLSEPEYIEATKILHDSWQTWAPDVLQDYEECHQAIMLHDPSLDRVCPAKTGVDLPFASLTANLGPQTVCDKHRDVKNRANGGVCVVKTLGKYDWQWGGHIVLHELGLVVEMKPGDALFFPSAIITHSTIPILDGETRYSLVWYSAGGLFRWKDADFQTHVDWRQDSPEEYRRHQKEGELRWNQGWKKFATLSQLSARVSKAGVAS
ncbi:hypothetical protein FRC01_009130 [Tulasnella sp. 417]|nr:hypothetical protein FRC01_009130 [Tulasnella sp. 417]